MQLTAFTSCFECVPTCASEFHQLRCVSSVSHSAVPHTPIDWLLSLSASSVTCRFYIEDLSDNTEIEQHGAESNTGFASAAALQAAIQAGAMCIGRTKAPEAALG